jgi:hypothetical protein
MSVQAICGRFEMELGCKNFYWRKKNFYCGTPFKIYFICCFPLLPILTCFVIYWSFKTKQKVFPANRIDIKSGNVYTLMFWLYNLASSNKIQINQRNFWLNILGGFLNSDQSLICRNTTSMVELWKVLQN